MDVPLQYACFACRKSFKRPQFSPAAKSFMTSAQIAGQRRAADEFEHARVYKCPDCGGPTHYMGKDFKAPKKSDVRAWREAQEFVGTGNIYYRGTGTS